VSTLLFSFRGSLHLSPVASVAILPSELLVEQFSLRAWWAFPIQANRGFVVVGTSRENASFAVVERMRQDLVSAKGRIVDSSRLWRKQQRPGARMEIPLAAATL
jgi:hypothetical protein